MRTLLLLMVLTIGLAARAAQPATAVQLVSGKSSVVGLASDALRVSVGNPDVADVMLLNPREIYLLGKKPGTTNVMVWTQDGNTTVMDASVTLDVQNLRAQLKQLMPTEKNLVVEVLGETVVLGGVASDPIKLQRLVSLTEALTDGKKIINLMRVEGSQQIMLEVKVAEISRTLLNELGVGINGAGSAGSTSFGVVSSLLGSGAGTISTKNGDSTVSLSAEIKKGLIKILAEPTITAISGQEGSFLAGGKIFIPVPQTSSGGTSTIALEEREFGVGLKFTPTVLEDGLINLHVTPEVSELSLVGTTVTANGQTSVLPSITTRRASTTVQLRDGESFVIGGLIKSNVTEAVRVLPGLGDIPILGVLFRSTAFQAERTELVFVVTPHLAKPLRSAPRLPTASFIAPSSTELMWHGRLEGVHTPPPQVSESTPAP